MSEMIRNKVEAVINPETGKTLGEEKRILVIEEKESKTYITFNRDGMAPDVKRKIEDNIFEVVSNDIKEDDLFILTKSNASNDVYRSIGKEIKQQSKPAQLKVGHGTVGEKKRLEGIKNVICIGSGKGGVGKSTYTANFARTLVDQGYKVGVIDADIYGPSFPMLMNMRGEKPESTEDKKIIPLEAHGIKFISFGNFIHEDEPVVWRGPMLGGVLNQFFFDTDWGELDYLLLDLPPGTGDIQLSMVQSIELDGAIIVSTPQDIALLDARKALHMFDKLNIHVIGMVENMSSFVCDDCGKEHFLYGTGGVLAATNELGVGYLGKIPLDMGLRKGSDFGTPYMAQQKYEGTKVWKAFKDMGQKIDGYFNPSEKKKESLISKIFNKKDKPH
jgi:ATP-binding protein involved in chromosome partitioning